MLFNVLLKFVLTCGYKMKNIIKALEIFENSKFPDNPPKFELMKGCMLVYAEYPDHYSEKELEELETLGWSFDNGYWIWVN